MPYIPHTPEELHEMLSVVGVRSLDEEGLRQAKMTYLPADFLRKYKVCIRKS